jgi:hypothetical protein
MTKRGRATKYDEDFHPQEFIKLSEKGKTFAQIAAIWKIHRDTLHEWSRRHEDFSDSVKMGRQLAEGWYMEVGQNAMLGRLKDPVTGERIKVDLGWFCWMTKNMFKWTDKVQVDQRTEIVDVDKETALMEWLKRVGKD